MLKAARFRGNPRFRGFTRPRSLHQVCLAPLQLMQTCCKASAMNSFAHPSRVGLVPSVIFSFALDRKPANNSQRSQLVSTDIIQPARSRLKQLLLEPTAQITALGKKTNTLRNCTAKQTPEPKPPPVTIPSRLPGPGTTAETEAGVGRAIARILRAAQSV